jgi:hypothetical protein
MKRFNSNELREAYRLAGFRERFAMDNGNRSTLYINGEKCYKFTYSKYKEYQDANGAIYNTVRGVWIN